MKTKNVNIFKKYEKLKALSMASTRIQDELLKKNKELLENNKKLEEFAKLKDEFISSGSHKIRTHLSAIKGALDLLVSGLPELSDVDRRLVDIAMKNSNLLEKMIEQILTFKK